MSLGEKHILRGVHVEKGCSRVKIQVEVHAPQVSIIQIMGDILINLNSQQISKKNLNRLISN